MSLSSTTRTSVLTEIAHDELKRLLYGEIDTAEDLAKLTELAEAAGVALELLLPATGEPGHDPRATRPAPAASRTETNSEETTTAATTTQDSADEAPAPGQEEFDGLKVQLFADIAEFVGGTAAEVQALMDSWTTARDLEEGLRSTIAERLVSRRSSPAALAA
ncbi:hypothetical protein [Nocardiopsis rhodophaea]|uniref:hypothetical protein n=1 Tax=Nocardiopsis rhodophaea TaxID=280238 RepID=UPI0031E20DA3